MLSRGLKPFHWRPLFAIPFAGKGYCLGLPLQFATLFFHNTSMEHKNCHLTDVLTLPHSLHFHEFAIFFAGRMIRHEMCKSSMLSETGVGPHSSPTT